MHLTSILTAVLTLGVFPVATTPAVDSFASGVVFHDANGNGYWDNGEDIVRDVNDNAQYD